MPAGPGSLDAEGVWQYGEADTESLASDLLNLGQESVSTQFGLDRARLDDLEAEMTDWATFATTLTGITLGTGGTVSMIHRAEGDMVHVRFKIVLGGAGMVVAGNPTLVLPSNSVALNHPFQTFTGDASFFDVSAGINYPGKITANSTDLNKARIYHTNTGAFTGIAAASPFAWATSDVLSGEFWYRKS